MRQPTSVPDDNDLFLLIIRVKEAVVQTIVAYIHDTLLWFNLV